MAIHILGNGPSISIFDRDAWPETDVFVGCNFSDPSFRVNYTSVIDVGAMKQILKGHTPAGPVLLSTRAKRYADKEDSNWRDNVSGIEFVMTLKRDRTISRNLSMNSAQHATVYSIDTHKNQKDVHLWGIDSFWSTDLESKTDAYVRPNQKVPRVKPKITRQWNRYWHKIFSNNVNHSFIIHRPDQEDVELVSGFSDVSNFRVVDGAPT